MTMKFGRYLEHCGHIAAPANEADRAFMTLSGRSVVNFVVVHNAVST
jgi:hypothetical protein